MNTDSQIKIGSSHTICQDYALSGVVGNKAYAIVCDGCSSSQKVDVGARLMAHIAEGIILSEGILSHGDFKWQMISRAKHLLERLPSLGVNAFDTTVLVSVVTGNQMVSYMFGDGVLFIKTKDGLRSVHVGFKTEIDGEIKTAPAYLSYFMDSAKLDTYKALKNNKKEVTINSLSPIILDPFDPVVETTTVAEGDRIILCSDGIDSFQENTGEDISWKRMVDAFVEFPNTNGTFAERRLAALERENAKFGINHYDDISLAAIIV